MTIGSSTGAGNRTNLGSIGMGKPNDAVSKGIQQQIANAQKRLQEISSDDTLSMEEKMKKRQEIQQEITNLNQQLRQHEMEMRKEQQAQQRAAKQQSGGAQCPPEAGPAPCPDSRQSGTAAHRNSLYSQRPPESKR